MNPRYVITGIPGSGTTFTAKLFHELGFDLGVKLVSRNERRGLEWEPLKRINGEYADVLNAYLEQYGPVALFGGAIGVAGMRAAGELGAAIEQDPPPEVVKCPNISITGYWLWQVMKPELVILCVRPLDELVSSYMVRYRAGQEIKGPSDENVYINSYCARMGLTIDALTRHEVPYVILEYPRSARDLDYAWDTLARYLNTDEAQFIEGWARAVREDYIGYSVREGTS